MLTADQLAVICQDVDYRGWCFTAVDTIEGPMVRIVAPVIDSRNGQPLDLGIDSYPSPNDRASASAFLKWLGWRLQRVELHESQEHLKYEGVTVSPPAH